MLDEGHGGFERDTPRDKLRRGFDETAARLTAPMTELEFYIVPDIPVVPAIEDLLARRDVVMERAMRFLATGTR